MHTLAELTGDFVVYRNLEPFHADVPGLSAIWRDLELASPRIVRKREPDYPRVVTWLLRRFHEIHAPRVAPSELLLIGDTLSNDGGAYQRLAAYTGWPGAAFIGREEKGPGEEGHWQDNLFVARRWRALGPWLVQLRNHGLALDEHTIVIVDVDKTALGARGRNHAIIDQTRLQALRATVVQALGEDADFAAFSAIYHELNQAAYHDLTGDNQDYLAYISLMSGAGVLPMAALRNLHAAGEMNDFDSYLHRVQGLRDQLPPGLRDLHDAVFAATEAHDPTPFKDFRRNEYRMTVANMGSLPDDAAAEQRQAAEICLTREVWDACRWLQQRGAMIVALSDKPDEACAPTPELAAAGLLPIHQTLTHLLGAELNIPQLA